MKYSLIFPMLLLALRALAQTPEVVSSIKALGTRSWIRVDCGPQLDTGGGYKLYWSTSGKKEGAASVVLDEQQTRYYIQNVLPDTKYTIWVEAYNESGTGEPAKIAVKTEKTWKLLPEELIELQVTPSSVAVPPGMELVWHDEFNELLLNRNKWSTNYYSSIDHLRGEFEEDMRNENLAQPAYMLNGNTINLYVSDTLPTQVYDQKNQKKISSIQTYDWRTNECLLDNSRGGYFEVKVKRSNTGQPRGLNTAFWFDAPGPDLRNYLERGATFKGVQGIRPKGQVFEIDVFEYITAQFVLHGHVDRNGKFQRNIATHIAEGYEHFDKWVTHGILWSPTEIRHYINGNLIKAYTDKHNMHSPNHFMNVFLGSYGGGGTVNMEVDYIRLYQWPLRDGNELPNPGFDDGGALAPWEGTGSIAIAMGQGNTNAAVLLSGQYIEQYLYLDNDEEYYLEYLVKGGGLVEVSVDDVELVKGKLTSIRKEHSYAKEKFSKNKINFRSGKEYQDYKKKIRISFRNDGRETIWLDDVRVLKR